MAQASFSSTTASAAPAPGAYVLKAAIRRQRSEEKRRARVEDASWPAARALFAEWVGGGAHYTITYVDPEGDVITVGSEPEWDECCRLLGPSIRVELTVRRHAPAGPRTAGAAALPTGDLPEAPELPPAPRRLLDGAESDSEGGSEAKRPRKDEQGEPAVPLAGWAELADAAGGAMEVVRRFLRTGAASAQAAAGRASCLTHEMAVKIAHDQGMQALARGDDKAAAMWFQAQVRLQPAEPLPQYNLACALALVGELDKAVEALRLAVEKGYLNVAHMRADEDLAALRSHPAWEQVLGAAAAAAAAAGDPPAAPPAAAPAAAGGASPASWFEVRSVHRGNGTKLDPTVITVGSAGAPPAPMEVDPQQDKHHDPMQVDGSPKHAPQAPVADPAAPAPDAPREPPAPEEAPAADETALQRLREMGFIDDAFNAELLRRHNGNLTAAAQELLSSGDL
eukprot:TRINITY_DN17199_c3_g1_i1.p1 TRINITY_DN17199_c3_g1~~TRINITY_DN17199_c3_g1_i1.p1  ORF type:complete len:484 (+),score=180.99 TRINITY_DN17199_c3_g1_i1:95-1453(+)